MTEHSSFSIHEVASKLGRPEKDILESAKEILNINNAVMFNLEQYERLSTHFREKDSEVDHREKNKRLTIKARVQTRNTTMRRGGVPVEIRKQRGKKAKKETGKVASLPAMEASSIVKAPVMTVKPKQEDAKERHALQDKILDTVSQLNKGNDLAEHKAEEAPQEIKVDAKAGAEVLAKPIEGKKERNKKSSNKKRKTITVDEENARAHQEKHKRRRKASKEAPATQVFTKPVAAKKITVEIPESISVRELALAMSLKSEVVKEKLDELEEDVKGIDEPVEQATAELIVEELGHKPVAVTTEKASEYMNNLMSEIGEKTVTRHPVVTVMGHVDHGKTSLLDYIRNTKVTDSESGGITQHIGAYQVETKGGKITFIDTPGHEAFTEMRARGAHVTDFVVLVIAADDGVQPQTVEAIDHAKAADVPIIVAVNKIDVAEYKKEDIYQQLSAAGLLPEEWSGDVIVVPVSAMTGEGVDKLLESILLTAEIHKEKMGASLDVKANGYVVEVNTDKGLGPVITCIVRQGVLEKGQFVLCDTAFGKVRALRDENGKLVDKVGPSTPVQIQGIPEMPKVGCEFVVADSEVKARQHIKERKHRIKQQEIANQSIRQDADSFEEQFERIKREEERKVLNVIIKADVAGTCEALEQKLSKIGNENANIVVIRSGVGEITESDVILAQASDATLIGFRVTASAKTRKLINERNVLLTTKDVFYDVTDEIKAQLEGMLVPVVKENVKGTATVKEVFTIHKVGRIAGCGVMEGKIDSKLPARVVRDGTIVYKTKIAELRHHKDKAQVINAGSDCGIHLEKFSDFKPGDIIESFEEVNVQQKL